MDKTELIINAILDKYGSGINIYTSSDILTAAGISEDEAQRLLEQFKQSINASVSKLNTSLASNKNKS